MLVLMKEREMGENWAKSTAEKMERKSVRKSEMN
jgi:hypothetical protein